MDTEQEDPAKDEEPCEIHTIDCQSFLDEQPDLILDQARESAVSLLLLEPSAELTKLICWDENWNSHDSQKETDMAKVSQESDRIPEVIAEECELLQGDLEGICQWES